MKLCLIGWGLLCVVNVSKWLTLKAFRSFPTWCPLQSLLGLPNQKDQRSKVWFSPAPSWLDPAVAPAALWWNALRKHNYANMADSLWIKRRQAHPLLCFSSPKSPLSRASASGGFLSLRSDSSCGFDKSICWSKAGSSSPWGEDPRKAIGVEGCAASCGGACCCGRTAPRWLAEEEVPGTVMERKSIRGRPK